MAGKLILPASHRRETPPPRPREDLQLLIKPVSGRCNLTCGYCFYRPVHEKLYPDATVMSGEVLSEMIRQMLSMNLPHTSFSWQGGEPTLAGLDFFKEAVRLMMKHGRGGQAVGNAFQTNGILLDDRWADFFVRYKFLVGVSIDGPPDLHDRCRGGSFKRAMRGARTAMKIGVEVNVLSCVSRASEGRARETYEFLKGEGFRHLQYIPVVEHADRPGGAADFNVRPEAYGDFLIELFETWRADPDPACIRLFDGLVEIAGTGRSPFCILAPKCAAYLVVEASGDLYPCDFFVREELKVGNLLRTPIPAARALPAASEFAAIKLTRPEKCGECKWWKVCRGGCLKERLRSGGFDRPGYLCEGMKRFLNHSWRQFEMLGRRQFAASSGPSGGPTHEGTLSGGRRGQPVESTSPGPSTGRRPRAGAPCPCGSGRKYRKCCGKNGIQQG